MVAYSLNSKKDSIGTTIIQKVTTVVKVKVVCQDRNSGKQTDGKGQIQANVLNGCVAVWAVRERLGIENAEKISHERCLFKFIKPRVLLCKGLCLCQSDKNEDFSVSLQ